MADPGPTSRTPELIAALAALLALIALFLPWYATDSANGASNIDGVRGSLSGWTVHEAMRYVMLGLGLVQFALILNALRRPGAARDLLEATMVLAVNSIGIVAYFGLIYRPGEPPSTIELRYGWFLAAIATVATFAAATYRVQKSTRRRGSPVAQPVA